MTTNPINPESLIINDLTKADLPAIAWSGSATHMESVRQALDRVPSGEVEYLAVRAPDGSIVAKGGIDYAAHENAGTMWALATRSELQSHGIGTKLIKEMEMRIRSRGISTAVVGVEENNPRARTLYEGLGYKQYDTEQASWESLDTNGKRFLYEAEVILLRKDIAP